MFWRILKKDLKRKKSMNIILLLFIIMCTMFAAASMNNISAVTGGIENYFDMADVPDVILSINRDNPNREKILNLPSVKSYKAEETLTVLTSKKFTYKGKKMDNFINPAILISDKELGINYFDKDQEIIKSVPKGSFYATKVFTQKTDIKPGDTVVLHVEDNTYEYKFLGTFKGAVMSTEEGAAAYLIMNHEDFDELAKEETLAAMAYDQLYIKMDKPSELKSVGSEEIPYSTREDMKGLYFFDMLAAYIMLVVSVILMITAFVVLRFTIGFTITEEFREIGVMKALGINNLSIRGLYMVKYMCMAVVGALIGFGLSFPLSDVMMESVSQNLILKSSDNVKIGLISALIVIVVILLFCFFCTGKVKRMSPIDAVRNGQNGERFKKKSILHLGKSKLPTTGFLAWNDVLSAPKRFILIAIVFSLCVLMMTTMSTCAVTLKDPMMLKYMNITTGEAHVMDMESIESMMFDFGNADTKLQEFEDKLRKEGMETECSFTIGYSFKTETKDGDKTLFYMASKGKGLKNIECTEGYAPKKNDEVALTGYAMKYLGVKIGDKIKVKMGDEIREFIVTGRFSSFLNAGLVGTLCIGYDYPEDFKIDGLTTSGIQIHFTDNPDKKTITDYIKKIRNILDSDKVYSSSECVETMTGMSSMLNGIKNMMMVLTVVVTVMIVLLMERSFISREKSEIALMKAVGIDDLSIMKQHSIRFVITAVVAAVIASIAVMPVSDAMMNAVCSVVGDVTGVHCSVDAVEVFVICPLILIVAAGIGSILMATNVRRIKASDTSNIE